MSDVYVAIAAGAVSALVLTALAVRGFGQPAVVRFLDGLLALGFAGYAGYLFRTRPDGTVIYYVFAVPVVALLLMWPARRGTRARRFAAGLTPPPYAEQNAPTPLTPFPEPPPPLGSPAEAYRLRHEDLPERPVSPGPGVTRPPIPSGLAGHHQAEPTLPGAYQPKPSGLPAHHPGPAEEEPAPAPRMPSGLSHPPLPDEPLRAARHAATAGDGVPVDQPPYVGTHSGEQPLYRPSVEGPADRNVTGWPADQRPANWPPDQQASNWPTDEQAPAAGRAATEPAAPAGWAGTQPAADQAAASDWFANRVSAPVEPPAPSSAHAEPQMPGDPRYSDYGRPGSYGYAGADDGQPRTTPFDYETVQETSSRLRQPAYLAEYAPAEPPDEEGRHRAGDQPRDWPPREWPPPRR